MPLSLLRLAEPASAVLEHLHGVAPRVGKRRHGLHRRNREPVSGRVMKPRRTDRRSARALDVSMTPGVVADRALQRQRGLRLRMDAAGRGEHEETRQTGDAGAHDQDAQPST